LNSLSSENFDHDTFLKFSELILAKTGIVVSEKKKSHLSNRLRGRIKQLNLDSFCDYWNYLNRNGCETDEFFILFDAVSTKETYFQRGTTHFKILENYVLPEFYQQKKKQVNIWSCGTSTGEEAYDLIMIASEFEKKEPDIQIFITGTDISHKALQWARNGEYADRRIDKLSSTQVKEYFEQVSPDESSIPYGKNVIRIKDKYRKKVTFQYLNLICDHFLTNMDAIFCRNVLIYFNKETQLEIVEKFINCLNPGGYLFLGHSESLHLNQNSLTIVSTPDGNVYKKPE
jgi:chemotaxis protein methyltransferase CheR